MKDESDDEWIERMKRIGLMTTQQAALFYARIAWVKSTCREHAWTGRR